MHAGADNDTDGWWLARFDHPDGGRSYTAASGMRADESWPAASRICRPRENSENVSPANRGTDDRHERCLGESPLAANEADLKKAAAEILETNAICILSTIPPHPQHIKVAREYNDAIRRLAKDRELPLIDYEQKILRRRPKDWNGTLLGKDDVHPSVGSQRRQALADRRKSGQQRLFAPRLAFSAIHRRSEADRNRSNSASENRPETSDPTCPKAPSNSERESLRLPVTRDTWFSNVGAEIDGNNRCASRLKVKSYQELSVIDVDPAPLRGHTIRSATLHLHMAGNQPLRQ